MHPVNPRPLYRSITFSSGILVLAFICWAWCDSLRAFSFLRYGHAHFSQAGSGVAVGYDGTLFLTHRDRRQYKAVLNGGEMGVTFTTDVSGSLDPVVFPLPMSVSQPNKLDFFLPHWLLLLPVVLIWTCLLLLRARRHRRTGLAVTASP